jgi:predicted nucleic acid-binding protein
VDVFFDTSVLVAASESSHPHHARAVPVWQRVAGGQDRGYISAHALAETYATLTRLPVQPRIHPAEAARLISENLLPRFQAVPLTESDYAAALATVATGGWIGAKIYDALLLHCAARCGVERVYTFNLTDFQRLAPPALRVAVCAP